MRANNYKGEINKIHCICVKMLIFFKMEKRKTMGNNLYSKDLVVSERKDTTVW